MKFNTQEDIDNWHVSTDAGFKIGKTRAQLRLTPQNTGLFSGYLSNEYDKPEKMRAIYTGYANMQSLTQLRSFFRKKYFDFKEYNCFLLKIRGDGRTYMMVLNTPDYHTNTYNYLHMYPLHTRGGPYWQYAKIPFSKFFHANFGRVADIQYRFFADSVRNIGITCMDGIEGNFQLEIDSISVLRDDEETEEFAYEMYKIPKYIANT
jgi:NADH dehydrogenase [ubiquinone] 1 alpha subcomplex assembly factor 1